MTDFQENQEGYQAPAGQGQPPVPKQPYPYPLQPQEAQQPYPQQQQPYQYPQQPYPYPPQPQGAQQPYPQPYPQQPAPQPAGQAVRYKVHHTYIWLGGIRIVFSLAIAFAVYGFATIMDRDATLTINGMTLSIAALIGIGVALFVVIVCLVFFLQYLSYKHLWYELSPEEFSLYSGILNKKRVHVPYQRVQSVNQKATLIQRICGVCIVHVDTAGGASNKAVVVPYLRNTDAERLRTELFARKQAIISGQPVGFTAIGQPGQPGQPIQPGQPLPPGAQPYPATVQAQAQAQAQAAFPVGHMSNVLDAPAEIMSDVRGVFGGMSYDTGAVSYEYGLSNKELFFTGLSNNTGFMLMVFAIIGSIVGLVSQVFEIGLGDQVYDQSVAFLINVFAKNLIPAIIISVVVFVFFIWVMSILGAVFSYGGFRACRRQHRIEVEHGIFQHRFHGVDIDRVQSVIIRQSFIRRLIGYCEISLGKIDAHVESAQDNESGGFDQLSQLSQKQKGLIVHPFVKMSRVPEILAGLVPEFADVPTDTIKLPKRALRRAIIRRCVIRGNGLPLAVVVALAQVSLNLFAAPLDLFDFGSSNLLSIFNIAASVFYLICALIVVIEAINALLWYRGSGFAFNRYFMQITNGGFSRENVSFPRKKIQFGYIKTNPLQRLAKVATINARTAAGIGGTTMHLLDVSETEAQRWLEWVKPFHDVVE